MAVRVETLTYGEFQAPAGTVVTTFRCTFTDASGNHVGQDLAPGAASVTQKLTQGTWTFSVQNLDQNGAQIGPTATDGPFDVPSDTVPVSIVISAVGMLQ
jgi:hypothetical protein